MRRAAAGLVAKVRSSNLRSHEHYLSSKPFVEDEAAIPA